MEGLARRENVNYLLWEAVRPQIQADQPFVRLTHLLYTELGIEGRQLFVEKISFAIQKKSEFILDSENPDTVYLGNLQDIESHFQKAPSRVESTHEPTSSTTPSVFSSTRGSSSDTLSVTSPATAHYGATQFAARGNSMESHSRAYPPTQSLALPLPQSYIQPSAHQAALPSTSSSTLPYNHPSALPSTDLPNVASNNGKIKQPLNPWCLFVQDMTPEVLKAHPGWDAIKINALLGPIWKAKDPEQQRPWRDRSDELARQHALKYPGWKRNAGKRSKSSTAEANPRTKKQKVPVVAQPEDNRRTMVNQSETPASDINPLTDMTNGGQNGQPTPADDISPMRDMTNGGEDEQPAADHDFSTGLNQLQEFAGPIPPGYNFDDHFDENFVDNMFREPQMGPIWRAKTLEEQKPWKDRADQLAREHALRYPGWRKTGGKRASSSTSKTNPPTKKQKISAATLPEHGLRTMTRPLEIPASSHPSLTAHTTIEGLEPQGNERNHVEGMNEQFAPDDNFSASLRGFDEFSGFIDPNFTLQP
ncbi:hypothetical protein F5Y18DRAFT_436871 [Xylariaceae sp. FL1019]|nr:hypothetical protein F5Y18DRAFT_436871 [Xylariaceae sp. FL1019]